MMFRTPHRLLRILAIALCVSFTAVAHAGEKVEVDAKLIWCTNHQKAPDKNYKRAEDKLSKDLQRAFKWTNYFVITSKEADTPKNKKVAIKMSDQCRLRIKYLGGDKFEVWIWGKDPKTGKEKAVAKGTQTMGVNQKVLIMGVNDNESGWVVKLCRHDK
jgi:hypothetical protein